MDYTSWNEGKMKVNGLGIVRVQPDVAIVNLGVVTENKDLETAQRENAIKSNSVINALRQMGIDEKDISTASYTIEPQYDYVEGRQIFRGYRVSNILNVKVRNINKVGEVVDNAVKNGANTVNNIKFTVDNMEIYYNKALKLALKDAAIKAREMANSLRVNLNGTPVRIIEESVREIGESPVPYKALAEATPILPGQINVTAKIVALFSYLVS
ncbi:SIMPL domain-containing protein [Clostridium malenominatum]|uniref:SIMPL domain-containing protein n=1 Tax=Clostridium malenominatum TaxID=1539 RepID=A0ABN1J683_9CLOT